MRAHQLAPAARTETEGERERERGENEPRGVSAAAPAALSNIVNAQDVRLQYPTEHLHTALSARLPL